MDDEKLTMADIAVFYAICHFARWKIDKLGKFEFKANNMFPSRKTIAKRAHCSDRTVDRALKHLEELGYIKHIQGIGNSNNYIIDIQIEGVKLSRKVCQSDERMRQSVVGDTSNFRTNNIINNINNNINNRGDKSQSDNEKAKKPEPTPEEIEANKLYALEQLKQLQEKFMAHSRINNKYAMYGTNDLEKLTLLDADKP